MTGEDVVLWLLCVCVLGGLSLGAIGLGKWRRARDDRRRVAALAACLAGRGGREVRASYQRAEAYEASSVRREGTLPGPAMPLMQPLGDYVRLTLSVACPGAPVRWEHRLTPPDGDLTAVRVWKEAGFTFAAVDGTAVLATEPGETGERAARARLAKALEAGGPVRTPHPEFDAVVRSVALDVAAADLPVEAHPHIRGLLVRNAPHESMLARRDGWLTWSTLITSRYDAVGPNVIGETLDAVSALADVLDPA